MLSFLLFAGALHVDINDLMELKWSIGALATVGTLISTFLVGTLTWLVLGWVGIGLSFLYCMLFGALISPTDPIAVLGVLKNAGPAFAPGIGGAPLAEAGGQRGD